MTALTGQPSQGPTAPLDDADVGPQPLPLSTMRPFDWRAFVTDIKSEARESRRAVEKRMQRLAVLDKSMRKQVEATAAVELAVQELEGKIEKAVQREKNLHRLIAAAKRRRTRLQAEAEEAEAKLAKMEAVPSAAVKKDLSAEMHLRTEADVYGKHEMGELQQRLHFTRSRYQKTQEENKRLWSILSDIELEDELLRERTSEQDSSKLNAHQFEFSNALQDLIKSFKEVTLAASAVEEDSIYR
ncbi:hypothetical protein TraAM80_02688 [Trypanosoma rangeli]|uniref:Uncharacterized protein n=1 Tax=Trypanosoma rangeli TaxID=5698 RepID=A0A3R7NVY5_TRYRA|nr:uncharacterized protein TraAM80_02688 [Trypanosoma rangeli]RNF08579.1 hypothetical protein TraAM80_02688 [Trypanosoma rangeli]|eukprot:RNF08579.1 hypothetical protein TraAM80_02688 [Trypanosoma rangeli]